MGGFIFLAASMKRIKMPGGFEAEPAAQGKDRFARILGCLVIVGAFAIYVSSLYKPA